MKQKRKKAFLVLYLFIGLFFQFTGIAIGPGPGYSWIPCGICIAVGAVFFSVSANRLYRMSYEKDFPEAARQERIEMEDERNVQIRNRAKARTSDISRWMVMALAWISFSVDGPRWTTLAPVGVFVLIHILDWYYMDRYQREM